MYNHELYLNLLNDKDIDIIIWTSNKYNEAKLKPNMYGWVKSKNNLITDVLVKKTPKNFINQSVITGIFTFKNSYIFEKCYDLLLKNNNKINSEYYIDSMIEEAIKLNLKCINFVVDEYFCWGTPYELKTFNYWQSYFHKWDKHPYNIKHDKFATNKIELIENVNSFTDNCD